MNLKNDYYTKLNIFLLISKDINLYNIFRVVVRVTGRV